MNQDTQNQIVERIIESKSFGKSHLYVNLLNYLVMCTQKKHTPKEAEVSLYLFGNQESYKDTAKVRVHIYNLRKKLKEYFEKEGKGEPYILTIPKGSYKVTFESRQKEKEPLVKTESIKKDTKTKLPLRLTTHVLLAVLLFLSLAAHLFLWTARSKNGYTKTQESSAVFWKEFLEEDKPTLVVLGDLFIFSQTDSVSGYAQNIRIPDVNSESQLESYINQYYENTTYQAERVSYTYLIKSSVTWIEQLTKVFYPNQKMFSTRVMSRLEAKDLQDYNIIFVGMQKTAGIFNNYFLSSAFSYSDTLPGYSLQKESRIVNFSPTGSPEGEHKDYGFISKFQGPNNNTIFMIGGVWDTATSESLKNFTNPVYALKLKKQMQAKFGKVPKYFEMLVEISGFDRVGLDTKIIEMQEIKKEGVVWTRKITDD